MADITKDGDIIGVLGGTKVGIVQSPGGEVLVTTLGAADRCKLGVDELSGPVYQVVPLIVLGTATPLDTGPINGDLLVIYKGT